jgi:hypothetical protein
MVDGPWNDAERNRQDPLRHLGQWPRGRIRRGRKGNDSALRRFDDRPAHTLTIKAVGQGDFLPAGGNYESGTIVCLVASADQGWRFVRWEGGARAGRTRNCLGPAHARP